MPEETTIWTETTPVCRHLRSKQYYVAHDFHSSGMESQVTIPCWCFKTHQPKGPDSGIASHDDCVPERGCFEKP